MNNEPHYSPEALADLKEIYNWLASSGSTTANSFILEIESKCSLLAEFPQIGRPRPDLGKAVRLFPYRRRVMIIYKTLEGSVEILRIFYRGRDYDAVMGERP